MTRNMLDRGACRKLEDLVLEHKAEFAAGKWTDKAFAEFAGRRIGRPVTAANILGARKTMDVATTKGGSNGHGPASLVQMRAALKIVTNELIRLEGEMGLTATPALEMLNDSFEN